MKSILRNPTRKCLAAILLTVVLLVPACLFLRNTSLAASRERNAQRNRNRLAGIQQVLDHYYQQRDELQNAYIINAYLTSRMRWVTLSTYVEEDQYHGPTTFKDGFVLSMKNGKAVYPEGWSEEILPLPAGFPTLELQSFSFSSADGNDGFAIFQALTSQDYAFHVVWGENVEAYLKQYMDDSATLEALESIYGGHLILFNKDGDRIINQGSDFFPENPTIESMGLDFQDNIEEVRTWIREDVAWNYISYDMADQGFRVVFFYPPATGAEAAASRSLLIGGMLALIAAAMITWHIATQRMVQQKILTKEQYRRFHPARVRRMTVILCLVCGAVVFIVAGYFIRIGSLQKETTAASAALDALEDRFRTNVQRNTDLQDYQLKTRENIARMAAEQMTENPELQNQEFLRDVAWTIQSEYVMLFDQEGNEIVSDQDYVGFMLGQKDTDEMYPFRRLLQGVETWTAEPAVDAITGQTLQKIGVRVPMEGSDRYGALIVAMKPSVVALKDLQNDPETLLRMITPSEAVCFAVNRKDGTISLASAEGMIGDNASAYGITETLLRDNATCGISFDGKNWYGASRVIDSEVWFYCVNSSVLETGVFPFALRAMAVGLLFLAVLAAFLLWGYTAKHFDEFSSVGQEVVHGQTVEVVTADGRIKRTTDPTMRWGTLKYRWGEMLPGHKARLVFQLMLLAIVAVLAIRLTGHQDTDQGLVGFIASGSWDRSVNLFSLSATVMMVGVTVLIMLFLRLIVQLSCMTMNAKGETVVRLVFNLIRYIAMFTLLFYGFRNFGIDTSALLGAMAFFSLAVSLGARDIVSDVLAGITIVFEGDYQVGDIVEIQGFRGKVMEIGARTTKLMGQGDNVKIISNRDVKNVLNMTRFNSWFAMELNISSSYPLKNMEEILQRELPAIGARTKKLISGPVYKGVEAIGKGSFRVTILAECREDDFRWVQRQLNREVRLLLDREEIPMV